VEILKEKRVARDDGALKEEEKGREAGNEPQDGEVTVHGF